MTDRWIVKWNGQVPQVQTGTNGPGMLLDIKPYFASTDSVPDANVGWHANRKR